MPHLRERFIAPHFHKLCSFWPIVGILGIRQVGKSTFLRDLAGINNIVTLDDDDVRTEAEASAKVFLAKLPHPCVIDEIQKVPKLFDGLKSNVDKKRIPGYWIITGSVLFQSLESIRESLAGRIGLVRLHPMTLAELNQLPFTALNFKKIFSGTEKPRLDIETFSSQMSAGGMPLPAFIREPSNRNLYFDSWLNALLIRDAKRVFGKAYDFELGSKILSTLGEVLRQGEFPQLTHFKLDPRKLKKYLFAFETLFLLRKFTVHEKGIGKDIWLPTDSGFAHHLMGYASGREVNLSLARIFIFNELISNLEYQGTTSSLPLHYYKSQHGSIIDLVIEGIPIKIVSENIASSKIGWIEKPLLGAMKTLNSSKGIILAPTDRAYIEERGISILPWSYFS